MDMLVSVGLPLALAFIMLSLGVGLTPADFVRVAKRPAAFAIGAACQVLLIPIVTYGTVLAFGVTGALAAGFLILAACPGGVTSNIISRLARGDVALSVSLTAIISLLSMVTVPAILAFALAHFVGEDAPPVDIAATALTMFALTAVPICIGVALRALAPAAMIRAEPAMTRIASLLFVLVAAGALAANWELFVTNLPLIGPALVVILLILTGLGYLIPRALGRAPSEAKTISIEAGIQNGTLGIAVAALVSGGTGGFGDYALPSAVYGILMFVVVLPVVALYRRID